MGVIIRRYEPKDRPAIEEMLVACGAFSDEEVCVALEMVDDGYTIFVADSGGSVVGYLCAGPTPLTRSTWHIYWICVHPAAQRQGIASRLQAYIERFITGRGGERVVVETSGRADYSGTRQFYERAAYQMAGCIPEYYKPGDDCIVYWKTLPPPV
jgi:ribosomal protein S18 acetylase RimI-like enzyme